jgi:hypothetical protein
MNKYCEILSKVWGGIHVNMHPLKSSKKKISDQEIRGGGDVIKANDPIFYFQFKSGNWPRGINQI